MDIYSLEDLNNKRIRQHLLLEVEAGAIFIYPTDTVYGIGCNALIDDSVKAVKKVKGSDKPLSVVAPSMQWIKRVCVADSSYLKKLPGKYTLIFPIKNRFAISKFVSRKTLGVRLLKHPMQKFFEELGIPIITTSANLSGAKPIISVKKLSSDMAKNIDFAIDAGVIRRKPSKVLDTIKNKVIRA